MDFAADEVLQTTMQDAAAAVAHALLGEAAGVQRALPAGCLLLAQSPGATSSGDGGLGAQNEPTVSGSIASFTVSPASSAVCASVLGTASTAAAPVPAPAPAPGGDGAEASGMWKAAAAAVVAAVAEERGAATATATESGPPAASPSRGTGKQAVKATGGNTVHDKCPARAHAPKVPPCATEPASAGAYGSCTADPWDTPHALPVPAGHGPRGGGGAGSACAAGQWHEVIAKPMHDPECSTPRVMLIQTDVSDKIMAEARLKQVRCGAVRACIMCIWHARCCSGAQKPRSA